MLEDFVKKNYYYEVPKYLSLSIVVSHIDTKEHSNWYNS